MGKFDATKIANADIHKTLAHLNPVLDFYLPKETLQYQKDYFKGKSLSDMGAFVDQANVLYNTILNKIGKSMLFTSNIKDELSFINIEAGMNYGDMIEMLAVGLAKTHSFDPRNEYNPFIREMDDVKSLYISGNYAETYRQTIEHSDTVRAFTSENGVGRLMTAKLASMESTKRLAHNFKKHNLLKLAEEEYAYEKVTVPADETTARAFVKEMIDIVDAINDNTRNYNAAHRLTSTDIEDMVFVLDRKYKKVLKVDMLTDAFNMEQLELPPIHWVREIGCTEKPHGLDGVKDEALGIIDNAVGLLVHKDFFKMETELEYHDVQKNAEGRYSNHFLHSDGKTYVTLMLDAVCLFDKSKDLPIRPDTSHWTKQREADKAEEPKALAGRTTK